MTFRGFTGEVSEVCRSEGELCVEWEIPRFLDLPCGGHDYYDSLSFTFYDARWHLEMFPNDNSFNDVTLFFCRTSKSYNEWGLEIEEPYTRTVIVSSGMKVPGGGVEWRGEEEETTLQKGVCKLFAWPFFKRSELREGDALTILCKIKKPGTTVGGASSSPDVPIRTDTQTGQPNARACNSQSLDKQDDVLAEESQSSEEELKAVEELQSSPRSLRKTEEDCKVTIKVRGKEIRTRISILKARSPIIQAMFAQTLVDCDPETYSDCLEHAYTGNLGMISADNVFSLYSASEKYDLKALKKECARFLERNVTVASFCHVIALAVKYNENKLIERATEFFCRNSLDIVKTPEWQIFLAENPTVGNELLIKLLSKHENIFRHPDQGKK